MISSNNKAGNRQTGDAWEAPIPLGRFNLPSFPLDAIPDGLRPVRELCAAVAESYQVPVDLPVCLALAVGGAALAKRVEVHVRGDHYEPVNLFIAVAMEPGERKSAVFRAVSAPLMDFEREEIARLGPEVERNQTERQILLTAMRASRDKAAKAKTTEKRDAAKQRAHQLTEELRDKPALVLPRYVADDATPEALARLMALHGGRIALLSPEGDTFELMAGRYSTSGAPNLGVYLKGHAGDDLRVDRVSRERPPEYVKGPALTVGLAVQPAVLHGLMEKPGFRGRGLLGRFLYALPNSRIGHRELNPDPVSRAISAGYAFTVRKGLELKPALDEDGDPGPHIVRVGSEALAELDKYAGTVELELGEGGSLATMRDWAGKLVGAICRIAGIYHGLIHAPFGNPAEHPLDAETMLCAIAIGDYTVRHAQAAYFEMGADPAIGLARRILSWLAEERPTEFTRRDAFNRLRGTVFKVEEVDEPLRLLTAHNYIREKLVERSGPGRRPSPSYEVNPIFYAQITQNAQNPVVVGNCAQSAYCAQGVEE